jgi:hypothetical protein
MTEAVASSSIHVTAEWLTRAQETRHAGAADWSHELFAKSRSGVDLARRAARRRISRPGAGPSSFI